MKKPSRTFSHQKRFGQYFSGDKVAALLSLLLPQGLQYCSIIDPMVGKTSLLILGYLITVDFLLRRT